MKTRKTLALILSILMIISMLPTTIFAAPSAETVADASAEVVTDAQNSTLLSQDLTAENQILEIGLSDGALIISGFNNLASSDIAYLFVCMPGEENPQKTVYFQYVTTDTTVFDNYYGLFNEDKSGIYKFYLANEAGEIISNVLTFDFTLRELYGLTSGSGETAGIFGWDAVSAPYDMEVTYQVSCYLNGSVLSTWLQSETSFDLLGNPNSILYDLPSGVTCQFSVTAGVAFYDDSELEIFMPLTDETMLDSVFYEKVYNEPDTLYVWPERQGTIMDILFLKGYFAERVTDVEISKIVKWIDDGIPATEYLGTGEFPLCNLPVNAELYLRAATCNGARIPCLAGQTKRTLKVSDKIPLSLSWDESKKKILVSGTENIPDNMELTMKFNREEQISEDLSRPIYVGSITFTNKDTEIDPSKVLANKTAPFSASVADEIVSCESLYFSATFSSDYTITIADGILHGTVTAKSSAPAKQLVNVSVKPDDGYELNSLSVRDENGRIVIVMNGFLPQQKTFIMPASNVTISATFKRSTISIDLGEKADAANVRYAEIGGVVTEIEETDNKHLVEIGEENKLIEVVEKTIDGEFVKSQYFYVDMTAKTATKLNMDSYMTADSNTSIRTNNPMGVRFKSSVLTSAKNEEVEFVIDEYGFIVATEDALGDEELTLDFSKYVTGVAYNKESETDIIFDASDDEVHIFAGYVKNIPVANYKTNLVYKTYTKLTVNGESFVVYGEAVVGNIYDTASTLLADDTLDTESREKLTQIILDYENTLGLPGDDLYPEE